MQEKRLIGGQFAIRSLVYKAIDESEKRNKINTMKPQIFM
jgi:hypothetical protein